jgi:hypothetical protein
MFDFSLFGWPWENGIAPDATNDIADMYIERSYTKYLRTSPKTCDITPKLKGVVVALCRFKNGEFSWVIMDKTGVLAEAPDANTLGTRCDMFRLLYEIE